MDVRLVRALHELGSAPLSWGLLLPPTSELSDIDVKPVRALHELGNVPASWLVTSLYLFSNEKVEKERHE